MEIIPRSAEVKDLSIPIEKLETSLERYQRILLLHKKPYQMSKNMLNRYFKLYPIENRGHFIDAHRKKTFPIFPSCLIFLILAKRKFTLLLLVCHISMSIL